MCLDVLLDGNKDVRYTPSHHLIPFRMILLTFLSGCGESKGYVVESCPQFRHPFGFPAGGHSHKPDIHHTGEAQFTHLLRGLAEHIPTLPDEKKEGRRERGKETRMEEENESEKEEE